MQPRQSSALFGFRRIDKMTLEWNFALGLAHSSMPLSWWSQKRVFGRFRCCRCRSKTREVEIVVFFEHVKVKAHERLLVLGAAQTGRGNCSSGCDATQMQRIGNDNQQLVAPLPLSAGPGRGQLQLDGSGVASLYMQGHCIKQNRWNFHNVLVRIALTTCGYYIVHGLLLPIR